MAAQLNFERPFKYVFQDKDWPKKIAIGGLITLSCVVVVGVFVLAGYLKRVFLTLVKDENALIPEIDFGKDIGEGLGVVGLGLVYGIAYAIAGGILMFIPCLGKLLGLALALAMAVVLPVAFMRYVTTGQFSAAFDFKAIIDFIKVNLTNLLLMLAVSIVISVIIPFGGVACGIGVFVTTFWGCLASTVAMADVWRLAEQQPAAPSAPPPAEPPSGPAPAP